MLLQYHTDPLVNRRVAGVGFLMEAVECAEGASSTGCAADKGGVVTVVACTHSASVESSSPRAEKRTAVAAYTLVHSKRIQW